MEIKTIFLDLDDVCNQFTMPALYEVGCPIDPYSPEDYDPEWGFDIVRAANALHPHCIFSYSDFWNFLTQFFWATLPKSKELDFLLDWCRKLVDRKNICILSNPVQEWNPYVAAAKMEWIRTNLPHWLQHQFLIGPCKHICARPDALLIDDNDENIRKFRAAGGQALLVPRPWNTLHAWNTVEYLEGYFCAYGPPHSPSIEPPLLKRI